MLGYVDARWRNTCGAARMQCVTAVTKPAAIGALFCLALNLLRRWIV